jgi:predicted PurR-regulated permease PerM
VIAGAEIAGFLGILFAVPAMAVLKVLFDFFRVRLYTEDASPTTASALPQSREPDT